MEKGGHKMKNVKCGVERSIGLVAAAAIIHLSFSIFHSAAAAEPAVAVSLPPSVYTGRIKDYDGAGLHRYSEVAEVRVRKNGVLLARGKLGEFEGDTVCNYSVAVPMTTDAASANAAAVGDELVFEVDSRDAMCTAYASTSLPAAKSGSVTRLDLKLMSDTIVPGIDDDYVRYAEAHGRTYRNPGTGQAYIASGASYNPDADYDGDGVSNREEYLAGTDPFNAEEAGLKVTSFKIVKADDGSDMVELGFKPVYGFAYSVERSTNRVDAAHGFAIHPHRSEPKRASGERKYIDETEDVEERKVYLDKVGELGLFRIRLD